MESLVIQHRVKLMSRLSLSGRRRVDELWFSQQPVPGASFKLNDSVKIAAGEHAGRLGVVIYLETLEPEPVYLIEMGDGRGDALIEEHALTAAV